MATNNSAMQAVIREMKVNAGWSASANSIGGRLLHLSMQENCVQTIDEYRDVFKDVLEMELSAFLEKNKEGLQELLQQFMRNGYDNLVGRGYLSAKRFYDTYVLRGSGKVESVPFLFLRVSCFCAYQCLQNPCLADTVKALNSWVIDEVSLVKYFFRMVSTMTVCCATPILRSAGVQGANLSSCFIIDRDMTTERETVQAVCSELTSLLECKSGVGINCAMFSHGEKSINSLLQMVNGITAYFNDSNVRPVSTALYIEIWHHQIMSFLTAKLPENPERCANVFQGVSVCDLFFKMYKNNPDGEWFLFDPGQFPGLTGLYGKTFEEAYMALVRDGKFKASVPLKSVMFALVSSIVKTGGPYVMSKDAMNRHHWHETQGQAIVAANLCTEVIQAPGDDISTCNLASISLPECMHMHGNGHSEGGLSCGQTTDKTFCYSFLEKAVETAVFVINACIVGGMAPTEKVARGQLFRSMGIGVQGLADVFAMCGLEYFDEKSEEIDSRIMESMYFTAVKTSMNIVKLGGGEPHKRWEKSKLSKGQFHWQEFTDCRPKVHSLSQWSALSTDCAMYGTYNAQFIALMPTAGTSQLTGYADSCYPFFGNMATKVSNKEEIMRPNRMFIDSIVPDDLAAIRQVGGDLAKLPPALADKYRLFKSAFEYSPEDYIRRARVRAPFVDQSQSMTLFLNEKEASKASYVKDLLMYAQEIGLKTLMYYCRIKKETICCDFSCVPGPAATPSPVSSFMPESDGDGEGQSGHVSIKRDRECDEEQCCSACQC
ncbi:ribonucleotide reductase large subunit [Cricetid gammaherpesvirus 2]|uniref:Ribonucleoside-diphosphate reductase n=1 Tax=Cricetid gammaherpesvirus 2 TaxID=1605972 RepID=E9M5P4_9GAMA|nr:ribonucleotide reductase large subunit [Cricetid gammaherpesvirus 2]ADW24402.1 ribonucleotide reductase large subunit [Cricetid gammaherpesvirus 2]ADW24484.1 ribonucleotide reductase large subunit [Cricetid gammaherpesvirus 2]